MEKNKENLIEDFLIYKLLKTDQKRFLTYIIVLSNGLMKL